MALINAEPKSQEVRVNITLTLDANAKLSKSQIKKIVRNNIFFDLEGVAVMHATFSSIQEEAEIYRNNEPPQKSSKKRKR